MASTVSMDAKTARLEAVIRPYLLQLLKDAPDFGEISFSATLHDGDIGRVRIGAEVSRVVTPRAER